MIRRTIVLLTILLLAASAAAKPKLAVVIVVDQMRPDYLTKMQSLYTGGFRRLLDSGFQFTETYHEHAVTETGVGHATIATGCYPANHGIVGNEWWDQAKRRWVYCVEDSGVSVSGYPGSPGRSPNSLQRQVLGDWLRQQSPNSKVFSVTGKDRSAILLGGLRANGVYWYNNTDGKMVTSIYYTPVYPGWVDSFNMSRPADDYFSGIWDRLLPRDKYSGADSVAAEYDGKHTSFPHDFAPAPDQEAAKYYGELAYTPFADQLLLRFARELIISEQLGSDSAADLLMLSCSAGDYIGHRYGPSSNEIQDYYLRLDGYLNSFLAFLDSTVGAGEYVVALTGDHGVLPLPEELKKRGIDAGRINSDTLENSIKRIGAAISEQIKCSTNVVLSVGEGVILSYAESKAKYYDEAGLRLAVARRIMQLPFVADAFTREELATNDAYSRPYFNLYRNNYNPDRSPDIMLRFKEYWIILDEPHGTTHGTPYSYDTHVPLIFLGAGVRSGRRRRSCCHCRYRSHALGADRYRATDQPRRQESVGAIEAMMFGR